MQKIISIFFLLLFSSCGYNFKSISHSHDVVMNHSQFVRDAMGGEIADITSGGLDELSVVRTVHVIRHQPTIAQARLLLVILVEDLLAHYQSYAPIQPYLAKGFNRESLKYTLYFMRDCERTFGVGIARCCHRDGKLIYQDIKEKYIPNKEPIPYLFEFAGGYHEPYEEGLAIVKKDFPEIFRKKPYDLVALLKRAGEASGYSYPDSTSVAMIYPQADGKHSAKRHYSKNDQKLEKRKQLSEKILQGHSGFIQSLLKEEKAEELFAATTAEPFQEKMDELAQVLLSYRTFCTFNLSQTRLLMVTLLEDLLTRYQGAEEIQSYLPKGFDHRSIDYHIAFQEPSDTISQCRYRYNILSYTVRKPYEIHNFHQLFSRHQIVHRETYAEAKEIIKKDFPEIFSSKPFDFEALLTRAEGLGPKLEEEEIVEVSKEIIFTDPSDILWVE